MIPSTLSLRKAARKFLNLGSQGYDTYNTCTLCTFSKCNDSLSSKNKLALVKK